MNSKLMAQIFSDTIAASEMPIMVNGTIYQEHRKNINVTDELIEAMLYAQRELQCNSVTFGSYECYEPTKYGFDVDGCLSAEINRLNNKGIKTIGCCCGHGRKQGYIQVAPEFIEKMKQLDYEQLPTDKNDNGVWCFKPKTILHKI